MSILFVPLQCLLASLPASAPVEGPSSQAASSAPAAAREPSAPMSESRSERADRIALELEQRLGRMLDTQARLARQARTVDGIATAAVGVGIATTAVPIFRLMITASAPSADLVFGLLGGIELALGATFFAVGMASLFRPSELERIHADFRAADMSTPAKRISAILAFEARLEKVADGARKRRIWGAVGNFLSSAALIVVGALFSQPNVLTVSDLLLQVLGATLFGIAGGQIVLGIYQLTAGKSGEEIMWEHYKDERRAIGGHARAAEPRVLPAIGPTLSGGVQLSLTGAF